jgi:molybdopterin converting factor small subunit
MNTVFQIPRILQQYCEGRGEFELRGANVRDLLEELNQEHPALYQCICNETGALRQHIHLFINNKLYCGSKDLDTPLESGDIVSVFQAVSGG